MGKRHNNSPSLQGLFLDHPSKFLTILEVKSYRSRYTFSFVPSSGILLVINNKTSNTFACFDYNNLKLFLRDSGYQC